MEKSIGCKAVLWNKCRGEILRFLSIVGVVLLLSGCGTVSSLRMKAPDPNLFKDSYSSVVVERFDSKDVKTDASATKIEIARDHFADLIAEEIRATKAFSDVSRNKTPDKSTLVIGGNIKEYTEGDPMLRAWIGLGAGSVYFKALVQFYDGSAKEEIGTIEVDNNSWVGGGLVAAGQTPESFMGSAAKKVASEAKKLAK